MKSPTTLIIALVFGVIQLLVPLEGLQPLNPLSRSFDTTSVNCRYTPSSLFLQNEREVLEKELSDTKEAIDRLDALEAAIKEENADLNPLSEQVGKIEGELKELSSTPLSPEGLSMPDYKRSVLTFAKLPISLKLGLYIALGMSTKSAPYPNASDYPEIVSQLQEQRITLTIEKIEDGVAEAQGRLKIRNMMPKPTPGDLANLELDDKTQAMLSELLDGKSVDRAQNDNVINQMLGRVTRKDNITATAQDLDVLLNALEDKTVFAVRGTPEEIPGGYVVRGASRKDNAEELISSIDSKLPFNWGAQVSYMPDITRSGFEQQQEGEPNPVELAATSTPVLILLNKDFSPQNAFIRPLSTIIALITTLYYGINVFAGNPEMSAKLASGDFGSFEQFNTQILQVLAPIAATQIIHQLGHYAIATKDKFEISAPILIPYAEQLPNLGIRTDIKSSPPNLKSLFDFAFIGPFLGLTTAIVFLAYGLQVTATATPEMLQTFPTLSVADIRCSTLGGSIVDFILGGSNGAVTNLGLDNVVRLHPFAVAGFASLLIQALELLPLGASDGGRMSLALFGRTGNVLIGGSVWFALFFGTLFLGAASKDLLLGIWVVSNFAQNDMEIPSREEVTDVDVYRSLAGFSLWFVAILAVVPL